ncbi:hypothetical protein TYRP_004999 [Tyrophagus putrescentiae]|nr:hypothetical protein TYRP_004999 [Tyrophagus putrescentiae]
MPISAYFDFTNVSAGKPLDKIATSAVLMSNISQYLSSGSLLPNSAILSITVEKERESVNLKNGHKLMFVARHSFRLVFRDQPRCSFWNLSTNHWSTKGCQVNRRLSNRSSTVCECNHLTDFAALADVSNREKPSFAKSILTYISSTINCLFLFASILFTLKFNRKKYMLYDDQFKVKTKRFWLNLNVIVWLLISHLLIMFGMDRTESQIICKIISLFLLYSLLTAFNFTLMLSIHLYLSTSKRHLFNYVSFCNFAIFAYFFPLLFIIVSMIYIYAVETERNMMEMSKSLTGEYFCWISSSKYPKHILINCCLLGAILSIVPTQSRQVQMQISKRFSGGKAARNKQGPLVNWYLIAILLFNFGFPWLLYVFYINEQMGTFFSYFFIALNFTQGVALFAEQIYVYRSNPRRKKERPSESSSRSTGLTSVDD